MKNKKIVYLLILLVVIVWGMVIYRIYAAVSDNSEPVIAPVTKIKEPYDDYGIAKDTSRLQAKYRDPFGLAPTKDTAAVSPSKSIHRSIPLTVSPGINWAAISYMGYIQNPGSKKIIAIMHINGKEVMMTEGENNEQVKLLKNLRDSIKISYHGQTKFIKPNR
ncbi:hypothetical protein SAMN05428975_5928 [Mucilaginibacter sp. OK268]|uniref:hypothetical protein n=1 Tax=Mucilaginibacter sp. OK268 TaxID=1881048 RepID=UPI00088F9DCF|nr:hypothetical protein [Mucilaginibacter sp. OK268]SDQ01677.1 hypothetical protein SAMN05428975_5928 [Mucilaginibacter sp. OK268]